MPHLDTSGDNKKVDDSDSGPYSQPRNSQGHNNNLKESSSMETAPIADDINYVSSQEEASCGPAVWGRLFPVHRTMTKIGKCEWLLIPLIQ